VLGLDEWIASASDGTTLLAVAAAAILLGLRHAADPDHLAAVTALIAGAHEGAARRAGRLGLAWGLGHATTLLAFGLPIVLYGAYLPPGVERGAEALVGVVIAALAVWLLVRWRRGLLGAGAPAGRAARTRSQLGAYGIGLLHGMGGSAGIGVLLLASIHDHALAVAALALFAACSALSMATLSTGFGLTLVSVGARRPFAHAAPTLAVASFAFGAWYALGAA